MEEVRAPLAPDAERSVRTAVIGNFVDIFGLCTILPLIPFFVKDVGAPKIWVGLISGAQFLGCCLGNFTWGQVGDRRDPNAVALGLMVGDAVFFALTAACADAPSLCAVRVLTGFCAFWVLGETLISKVVPGPRVAEYKAKYLGGALLGQIFGPVNGGLLGTLGWAYPCYVAAAAAAAAAARLAYVRRGPAAPAAEAKAPADDDAGDRPRRRPPAAPRRPGGTFRRVRFRLAFGRAASSRRARDAAAARGRRRRSRARAPTPRGVDPPAQATAPRSSRRSSATRTTARPSSSTAPSASRSTASTRCST